MPASGTRFAGGDEKKAHKLADPPSKCRNSDAVFGRAGSILLAVCLWRACVLAPAYWQPPIRFRGLSENGLQVGDQFDGGTERGHVATVEIGPVAHSGNEAQLQARGSVTNREKPLETVVGREYIGL